ncbi:unnamed protein product, partial [Pylaiella littoralis]
GVDSSIGVRPVCRATIRRPARPLQQNGRYHPRNPAAVCTRAFFGVTPHRHLWRWVGQRWSSGQRRSKQQKRDARQQRPRETSTLHVPGLHVTHDSRHRSLFLQKYGREHRPPPGSVQQRQRSVHEAAAETLQRRRR